MEEAAAGSLVAKGDTYSVSVTYDETAGFPADAELSVREILPEESGYEERLGQIEETLKKGQSVNQALLLDIRILAGEEEIEPAEGSSVLLEITMDESTLGPVSSAQTEKETASSGRWEDEHTYTMGQDGPGTLALYHFPKDQEGPVLMQEAQVTRTEEGEVVASVETDSFSDYEAVNIGGNQTLRVGDTITIRESDNHNNRTNHSWTISNPGVLRIAYDRTGESGDSGADLWSGGKKYATLTAVGPGTATLTHRYYVQGNWRTETMYFQVNAKQGIDSSGRGDPIPTIANSKAGIYLLDIIDLDTTPLNVLDERNNVATKPYDTGVNAGHQLKILGWGASNSGTLNGINDYTGGTNGDRIPKQGIVQNTLSGGYPILRAVNGVWAESLRYLFDGSGSNTRLYNVDRLFKETDSGYYVFDSDKNFATLNPDGNGVGNTFTVYNSTFTQDKHPDMPIGFFPFMPYDKNEAKGSVNMNKTLEHHFAMHMESNFVIPETGLDADGNVIKFEFSGDDDMWVFIDDKLVLDIGGVHQPVYGSINFQSGQVEVQAGNGGSLTGFTKGDDVTHTMKIFYMERGGCDSNCKITFNMPIKRPIILSKEVLGKNASDFYGEPFSFRIMVETQTGSGVYEPYRGGLFPVGTEEANKTSPSVTPNADGIYTLRHGDEFETLGIVDSRRYYVEELNVDGTKFGETDVNYETVITDFSVNPPVRVTDTSQKYYNNAYGARYDASCPVDYIKHRKEVDFINKPVEYRIQVEKVWEGPPDVSHKTVKVALFKTEGSSLQMVEGTVREIAFDEDTQSWTTVYYLFDSPDQYQVRELKADGSSPVDPDGRLSIQGEIFNGQSVTHTYTVTYDQGTPDADGLRTARVINTIYKKVKLVKQDEKEQNLAEAVFTLKDAEGRPAGDEAYYTTGSDGLIAELALKAGTYYLEETQAPATYALLPERIVLTVDGQNVTAVGETSGRAYTGVKTGGAEDGTELFTFTIPNEKQKASLQIIKKSSTDTEILLQGAQFRVYKDPACTQPAQVFADSQGTAGESFTTGTDGTITVYGLVFGETYYLKETAAPEGYYLLDYPVKLEISSQGEAQASFTDASGQAVAAEAYRLSQTYDSTLMQNSLTVLNSPLYDLPSSGGLGTIPFTILGSALMAGIVLLEIMGRRKI